MSRCLVFWLIVVCLVCFNQIVFVTSFPLPCFPPQLIPGQAEAIKFKLCFQRCFQVRWLLRGCIGGQRFVVFLSKQLISHMAAHFCFPSAFQPPGKTSEHTLGLRRVSRCMGVVHSCCKWPQFLSCFSFLTEKIISHVSAHFHLSFALFNIRTKATTTFS